MRFNKNENLISLKENLNTTQEISEDIVRISDKSELGLFSASLLKKKLMDSKQFEKRILSKNILSNMISHNCFSEKIYIDTDLNVYPCIMEKRFSYGNLMTNDLVSIINNNLSFVNMNKDIIETCKDCEFRYACFDCRPDSTSENYLTKPWYCPYNPYAGLWEDKDIFVEKLLRKQQ